MSKQYTFIDLFCGIGGIRLGFEKANCECVCSIEIDKNAGITYNENFVNYPLSCDIRWKSTDTIPNFDILCGGFPCQPFSNSGNRKGFYDETSGNLFFEIIRLLKEKQPKAYFLENVYGLLSNDNGNTFKTVQKSIEELGYSFYYKIINSKLLVPQNRERIYMIGFKDRTLDFKFPDIPDLKPKLKDILETNVYTKHYTITDERWKHLQEFRKRKGKHGFGYEIPDLEGYSRTLLSIYKDEDILINQEGRNPRILTPRECARLQGFPDFFKIVVSDNHAYHQFGNSVTVPIIEYLAKEIVRTLNEKPKRIEPYNIQRNMLDY